MKNDVITLKSVTEDKDKDGYQISKTEDAVTVFAEKKSVTRSEFYSAFQAGVSATAMFVVNSMDYTGQNVVVFNNKEYDVVRTYEADIDNVELTCSDRKV